MIGPFEPAAAACTCAIVSESSCDVVARVYRMVTLSSRISSIVPAAVVVTAGTSFVPTSVDTNFNFAGARFEKVPKS